MWSIKDLTSVLRTIEWMLLENRWLDFYIPVHFPTALPVPVIGGRVPGAGPRQHTAQTGDALIGMPVLHRTHTNAMANLENPVYVTACLWTLGKIRCSMGLRENLRTPHTERSEPQVMEVWGRWWFYYFFSVMCVLKALFLAIFPLWSLYPWLSVMGFLRPTLV